MSFMICRPIYLVLSFCIFLTACPFFHKDPVVFQINEKKWPASLFSKRLAQKIDSFNIDDISDPSFLKNLKKQLIGDLLMEYLVQRWAKQHSLMVSEQEWAQAKQKIQNSYQSSVQAEPATRVLPKEVFELYLKRRKINQQNWEQSVQRKLLHEKVLRHIGSKVKKPSDQEIKSYYKNHLSLFREKDSLLIYHVFHKKKQLVLQARDRLIKESDLAKGLRGIGALVREKQWVERGTFALFDRAFSLKKKEISPVWHSPYGYHIIQVLEKKPARLIPYKEAWLRVQKHLMDQRRRAIFAKWVDTESQSLRVWKDPVALENIKVKFH